MDWSNVDEALAAAAVSDPADSHKRKHAFPGAVLLVGRGGEVVYHQAYGYRSLVPEVTPVKPDTVFDVASLTKVLVTTALAMRYVEQGKLSIEQRLSRIFQTFGTHGKEQMTVQHLLNHSSGYPATLPYYKQIAKLEHSSRAGVMSSRGAVDFIYNEIFRGRLDNLPGKVAKYSDIGFMLLGNVIEVLSGGKSLDKLASEEIFSPLRMQSTGFIDLSKIQRRGLSPDTDVIAPTLDCPWRGRVLCGEVHDENAWAMGGVAGHAGVFSTAADVHFFARELIECWHGRGSLFNQDVVRRFWTRDGMVPGSTWALGWDTPSERGSMSGERFGSNSVGHLAFTGCSLWINPEREIDVVLLSNRIHPTLDNAAIRDFRPKIHDLVMEVLESSG